MMSTFRVQPSTANNITNAAHDSHLIIGKTVHTHCKTCGAVEHVVQSYGVCNHCLHQQFAKERESGREWMQAVVAERAKWDPHAAKVLARAEKPQPSDVVLGKRKADALQDTPCTMYQTRSALYEALLGKLKTFYQAQQAGKASTAYISFHGSYSIVADPTVYNARQVIIVSGDLQKIAKLPHQRRVSGENLQGTWPGNTLLSRCDCDRKVTLVPAPTRPAPPQPAPAPHQSVLQLAPAALPPPAPAKKGPRQSDLSKWILRPAEKKPPVLQLAPPGAVVPSAPRATNAPASAPRATNVPASAPPREVVHECGGTVRITVADDLSHPLFRGQKIVVDISHPARS